MKQKEAMCSKGMSAMEIFPLLASQLRRAYNIRFLYDQGYTESRIATRLHMKESVVRMNMHSLYSRSSSQLLKMLVKLAEMDQNAKQGIGDPDAQLEMFILQYGV